MSMGADTKANTFGGSGALERGDRAPLEPLAQLGDAYGCVGTLDILARELAIISIPVDAAELVLSQAAKAGGVSMGADTKANTWGWQRTPTRSQSSP